MLSISYGWAQTIGGQIIDAETQTGIPYASIGVLNKGTGTVSDEKGYFSIDLTDNEKITDADSLAFLHIGYQTLTLRIADIRTKANTTKPLFSLEKEEFELPTISIEADEFKNEIVLGKKVEKKNVNLYYQSNQKGTELAAFVKVDKASYLKQAYFAIANNNYEQLYFRVNLYTIKAGKPSDRINPTDIIVQTDIKEGEVAVDLADYSIVVEEDFFISLEWLQAFGDGEISENLTFTAALSVSKGAGLMAVREGVQSYWKIVTKRFLGLHPKVGFYLIASQP